MASRLPRLVIGDEFIVGMGILTDDAPPSQQPATNGPVTVPPAAANGHSAPLKEDDVIVLDDSDDDDDGPPCQVPSQASAQVVPPATGTRPQGERPRSQHALNESAENAAELLINLGSPASQSHPSTRINPTLTLQGWTTMRSGG